MGCIAKYQHSQKHVNVENVNGAQIVTSAATVSAVARITYSLTGDDSSSFAISTSGVVSTSRDLAAGSYDFTVVATPAVGNAISKAFSVSVNTPPTLAANLRFMDCQHRLQPHQRRVVATQMAGPVDSDLRPILAVD